MTVKELTTLLNKNKKKTTKIDEEISSIKALSAEEIKKKEENLKKLKEKKQAELKKLKAANDKK